METATTNDSSSKLVVKMQESLRINGNWWDYSELADYKERRLYLYGEIVSVSDSDENDLGSTTTGRIVDWILHYNREDKGKPNDERKPIILYIKSPGGDVGEGFSLINAIKLSKTPVYTVNVGQWSSMAFLIGISGIRRFSFPNATFLLHDGSTFVYGSSNKVQDQMKFNERFENEVVRAHVLSCSKMTGAEYDALSRKEFYMLPEDAVKFGFIDEIITDLDTIL